MTESYNTERAADRKGSIMTQCFIGIDIGAATTKAVILSNGVVSSHSLLPSGRDYAETAHSAVDSALMNAGFQWRDAAEIVVTGSGAAAVGFPAKQATELSCAGKGINNLFPSAGTVVDIGAQTSRVVRLDEAGRPIDFVISERCATGSGRFLQVIARVLQVDLDDVGKLSIESKHPVSFGTGCAVFSESEAVSRITEGAGKADILAGVHYAIAGRISVLLKRLKPARDCAVVGGGAKDIGLVRKLEESIGTALLVPEEPRTTAAFGAALIASQTGS